MEKSQATLAVALAMKFYREAEAPREEDMEALFFHLAFNDVPSIDRLLQSYRIEWRKFPV